MVTYGDAGGCIGRSHGVRRGGLELNPMVRRMLEKLHPDQRKAEIYPGPVLQGSRAGHLRGSRAGHRGRRGFRISVDSPQVRQRRTGHEGWWAICTGQR